MNPRDFLAKADTAARSARVLLKSGDHDGACNRACYAMPGFYRLARRRAVLYIPLAYPTCGETKKPRDGLR